MWMMPLHLHVNQKSDYDYDDDDIFSFGNHFVQWSRRVLALLEEYIMRNISVKLF